MPPLAGRPVGSMQRGPRPASPRSARRPERVAAWPETSRARSNAFPDFVGSSRPDRPASAGLGEGDISRHCECSPGPGTRHFHPVACIPAETNIAAARDFFAGWRRLIVESPGIAFSKEEPLAPMIEGRW